MRPLLVFRPEPAATLAAAAALGLEAVAAPLFVVGALSPSPLWGGVGGGGSVGRPSMGRPAPSAPGKTPVASRHHPNPSSEEEGLGWEPPDALLLTSANAVRFHPDLLASLHHFPVYAVGQATAAAARAAGFTRIVTGEADAAAIVARAAADGVARLLHLAGREHRAVAHPGLTIERLIVYAADPVDHLPDAARDALARDAVALLHSPRAAALFARLVDEAALPRGIIAALSPAVAEGAGPGWAAVAVAARPTDAALLAAAARLCEGDGLAYADRR